MNNTTFICRLLSVIKSQKPPPQTLLHSILQNNTSYKKIVVSNTSRWMVQMNWRTQRLLRCAQSIRINRIVSSVLSRLAVCTIRWYSSYHHTFGFQSKKLSVIAKIVLQYLEIMESSITQAATKPANWERLKDRVKSWIESEHHCVTAQRICQTFNISRLLGSQLLKEILQTDRRHQISACSQTQDGNVTGT